jgi:hypothetical protein
MSEGKVSKEHVSEKFEEVVLNIQKKDKEINKLKVEQKQLIEIISQYHDFLERDANPLYQMSIQYEPSERDYESIFSF